MGLGDFVGMVRGGGAPQSTLAPPASAAANSMGFDPYATGGWSAVLGYANPQQGQPVLLPPPTPPDPYTSVLNLLKDSAAPSFAEFANMRDRLGTEAYGAQALYGQQAGNLQSGANNRLASIGLSQQRNNIDIAAANRQIPFLDALLGNANQGRDIQRLSAQQSEQRDRRLADSDATARGAMHAPGIKRTRIELYNNLLNQLGLIDTAEERDTLTTRESQQQARDRAQSLGLLGQQYGLDADAVRNGLDQGLTQLGLDQLVTTSTLLDKINSTNIAEQELAMSLIQQALAATGGIPPGFANSRPPAPLGPAVNSHALPGSGPR